MSWVDTVLDNPLNFNQMDRYLKNKFRTHERFIAERRNNERRAASDRRSVINNKQSTIHHSEPLVNNSGCNHKNSFVLGPFYIDHRAKSVLINGKVVELTRKEFDLFELLASDVERVFLADEIIDYLWPINDRATKSDLYQYMHLLRKKIEEDPNNPQWILTIKGFGYKLDVPRLAASEAQGINLTSKEKTKL
jgi:DNA-binding response OmpR family regulator